MKNTEMKNKVCRISSELDEKYAVEDWGKHVLSAIFLN